MQKSRHRHVRIRNDREDLRRQEANRICLTCPLEVCAEGSTTKCPLLQRFPKTYYETVFYQHTCGVAPLTED